MAKTTTNVLLVALCGAAAFSGCSNNEKSSSTQNLSDGASSADFDATAQDFQCILGWTKVRKFYITNKLGMLNEALAVANNPSGGKYPTGTIIQLIPTEAMVKRRQGFNADTHDWEFFSLATSTSGTVIQSRGTNDVVNAFGGNCFSCHSQAQPQYDLVCEENHGCVALPLTADQITAIQQSDPRCPKDAGSG